MDCSTSTTTLDGSGQATCTITDAVGGTYAATATYSGDSNYRGGSGRDTTATVGTAPSKTTVTDNAAGVVTGGSFTFTAAVTGSVGTPTGTIAWSVTDPHSSPLDCSTSTTTLDNNGQATCTITDAIAGTYTATATYSGDSNYSGGSGVDSTATVDKAASSTLSRNTGGRGDGRQSHLHRRGDGSGHHPDRRHRLVGHGSEVPPRGLQYQHDDAGR